MLYNPLLFVVTSHMKSQKHLHFKGCDFNLSSNALIFTPAYKISHLQTEYEFGSTKYLS